MSINFGYGNYGMTGMSPMAGMNAMGGMAQGTGQGGNVFRQLKEEYGCDACYRFGPAPSNYQMHVEPLPREVTHPSFWDKVKYFFFGG